jgi:hypothetical protein
MVESAEVGRNLSEYGKGNTERGDRELRTRKSRWLLSLYRRFGCKTLCSVWACRLRFAHAAGHGSGLPPCRTAMIIRCVPFDFVKPITVLLNSLMKPFTDGGVRRP